MKMLHSKKGLDFAAAMIIIVMITLPIIAVQVLKDVEDTKNQIGENQAVLSRAPYVKEDIINYAQKAGELSIQDVLAKVSTTNGFLEQPCGGTTTEGTMTCAIINTQTKLTEICKPDITKILTTSLNKELDKYIITFNSRSYTKMPLNNYDFYIEDGNIHAIATLPVEKGLAKKGTELDTIGKMWFAPSFTITAKHNLGQYDKTFETLNTIAKECTKKDQPMVCVEKYKPAMQGWDLAESQDKIRFIVPHQPTKSCYVLLTEKPAVPTI